MHNNAFSIYTFKYILYLLKFKFFYLIKIGQFVIIYIINKLNNYLNTYLINK